MYDPKVLDIKDEDLLGQVSAAVSQIAAVSLELNYPTLASIPHSVVNGYKNVLAVAVATDYTFDLAEKVRPPSQPCTFFNTGLTCCGKPAMPLEWFGMACVGAAMPAARC